MLYPKSNMKKLYICPYPKPGMKRLVSVRGAKPGSVNAQREKCVVLFMNVSISKTILTFSVMEMANLRQDNQGFKRDEWLDDRRNIV